MAPQPSSATDSGRVRALVLGTGRTDFFLLGGGGQTHEKVTEVGHSASATGKLQVTIKLS